eukprot:13861999-Ditylum_brightwellii.AAC.1
MHMLDPGSSTEENQLKGFIAAYLNHKSCQALAGSHKSITRQDWHMKLDYQSIMIRSAGFLDHIQQGKMI